MSRSNYRPAYKTPKPNPGGWITLLIVVVVGCSLCWSLTANLFGGLTSTVSDIFSQPAGPQASLTIAVSPEKAALFTELVNNFNQQKLKSSKGTDLRIDTVQLEPEEMIDAALAGNFQALSPDSSICVPEMATPLAVTTWTTALEPAGATRRRPRRSAR